MGPIPPVALPPVTAEYASSLQRVEAQVPPSQSAHRFSRAADGKTRVDSGNMSVISNPATAQTILLDHVQKTATIQPSPSPAPPAASMPQMPHFSPPGLPGQLHAPAVKVEDLGKSVLKGHEVEGKRFVTQPLPLPKPPAFQMPGVPKPPAFQMPGVPKPPAFQTPGVPKPPQTPGAPPVPAAPQPPTTTEVWNSTSMGVPMLMKMSGGFGQLTQVCHSAVPGEPHPSTFQIPQGYKVTGTGA
jgi:hypothetical protein